MLLLSFQIDAADASTAVVVAAAGVKRGCSMDPDQLGVKCCCMLLLIIVFDPNRWFRCCSFARIAVIACHHCCCYCCCFSDAIAVATDRSTAVVAPAGVVAPATDLEL